LPECIEDEPDAWAREEEQTHLLVGLAEVGDVDGGSIYDNEELAGGKTIQIAPR
jgi:hypothetical protein